MGGSVTGMFQAPGGAPPFFSPVIFPALGTLALSDAERAEIEWLQQRAWRNRIAMRVADSYYRGMQVITNLGIAIPPELSMIRTIVGWPRIGVDPIVERLGIDEFRLPGATDASQDLMDIWEDNEMDAELPIAFLDMLVKGAGWFTVGSPDEPGDSPVIGVESPLNMSVRWDVRGKLPKSGLQTYWLDGRRNAAFYTPEQTIHIAANDNGVWEITDRDQHNAGFVPLVRMPNEPTSDWRDGTSEINAALMSVTDAACRTLLGLEVAREFYSVPQKIILGAAESDFQSSDGSQKSAWDTYINKILALERDEDGNVPEIQQFKPYDPSVFTKLIEMYASQAAGILGAPPQDLGLYTEGNPVSAEAAQVSEGRRDRRARRKQSMSQGSLKSVMKISIRFMNNGKLPDEFKRISVDWMDPQLPNVAGTADAISKYTAAGVWVPDSDVTMKRSGLSQVERARMEADRKLDAGASVLAELAHSVAAKAARTELSVTTDILGKSATTPAGAPATFPAPVPSVSPAPQ